MYKTVMETIEEAATNGESHNELRKLLAQFSFRGDSVKKVISQLSGGEKARIALCLFMLRPANLLILDEVRVYFIHILVYVCVGGGGHHHMLSLFPNYIVISLFA